MTGLVNVFSTDLECETLSIQQASSYHYAMSQSSGEGTTLALYLTSKDCGTVKARTSLSDGYFEYTSTWRGPDDDDSSMDLNCSDSAPRYLLSFGTSRVNFTEANLDTNLFNASNILCKPSYGIQQGLVTLNTNDSITQSPTVSLMANSTPSLLPRLSPADLLNALDSSFGGSTYSYPTGMEYLADFITFVVPNVSRDDAAADVDLMALGIRSLFQAVSAQVAKIYFMESTNQAISGEITTLEERLVLRGLSFGLVVGFLVVMAILALALIPYGPRRVVPCDPGPLAGLATILARSPELEKALRGTGGSTLSTIRQRLSGTTWKTETVRHDDGSTFGITKSDQSSETKNEASDQDGEDPHKIKWFRPAVVYLPAKVIIISSPIAAIIVLEVLYQQVKKNNGLCDVSFNEYIHYTYTYIPTLFLVSIGLLFSSLDFTAKVFQPYHVLRRGNAPSSTTLGPDYLGMVGVQCLWNSARRGQFAVVSSSVGMIIVPLLTIAASGLFFTEAIPQDVQIQLSQTTAFSPGFPPVQATTSASDPHSNMLFHYVGGAGFDVANLVLVDGMAEPLFTYKNLVFPTLDMMPTNANYSRDGLAQGTIAARIPALRAQTNCSADMITKVTYYTSFNLTNDEGAADEVWEKSVDVHAPTLPSICGINTTSTAVIDSTPDNDTYFGSFGRPITYNPSGTDWSRNGTSCPTNLLLYGHAVSGTAIDLAALYCTPYLESVLTDVVLNAADHSLSPLHPPIPDETTTSPVKNLSMLTPLAHFLYTPYSPLAAASSGKTIPVSNGTSLDGFFAALLFGANPVDPSSLDGLANRDKLVGAVNDLYGAVVAQMLNAARVPAGEASLTGDAAAAALLNATLTVPNRLRLKQSPISTRVLEALLVVLVGCAGVTYLCLDTEEVLPKEVGCVAAGASLLVGGGVAVVGAKEEGGVGGEGKRYRLGWWEGGWFGVGVERVEDGREEEDEGWKEGSGLGVGGVGSGSEETLQEGGGRGR